MPRFAKEYDDDLMGEINVTSLVDVTLTLLIIFMISTPLFQGGIEVELPKTQTAQSFTFTGLVLTISKDKGIFLDDEPVSEEQLADKLAEYYTNLKSKSVYIRADEDIAYRKVIMALGMIRAAGFESIGMVAEPSVTGLVRERR
ncbi:MAG: biopolymer transporter ExbD [Candidatus Glassbacteria bacterium]|nr:biopolymer transporter ExbD [Candidatus Glassbacteria bacterium]